MNWFSFLVVAFAVINLFFPPAVFSESGNPIVIKSISHIKHSEAKETITFKLVASVVPKIFTLRGEKPRLVIDFPKSIYWGKNVIDLTDGTLASTIRIGLHQTPVERTRVVVDLSKETPVQYTSEYLDQENTLIVTLTPDTTEPPLSATPKLRSKSQSALSSQEELSARPLDQKLIPPVFSDKEEPIEPTAERMSDSVLPIILEISFDDSSSRGEMVLFRLNDFFPPTVSAIEKDVPRVLCDFMAMNLGPDVQQTILANGKYIERIRTARHQDPEKVRVVLDLSPDRDYDLQQVFFRSDNLFVLIVNELTPNKDAHPAENSGVNSFTK